MKKLLFGFTLFISGFLFAAPGNNTCGSATTLTVNSTCANTQGDLYQAGANSPIGSFGSLNDVWYKIMLPSDANFVTITVVRITPSSLSNSNVFIELFNTNSCGSLDNNSSGSGDISTSRTFTGLTPNGTYYFRVGTTAGVNGTATRYKFNVCVTYTPPASVVAGRMNEVFQQTILSPSDALNYPWEVTYGPDNYLWLTESKGYKVYRMDPSSGAKTTVLDISQGSTFLPAPDQVFNCQFGNGAGAQGGLAGLAIHPLFLDATTPKNYIYLSYIYSQTSSTIFTNRVVRFTYNTGTGKLESPVWLCDTIPGSSDHNSQRMIIKPVGGTDYLFYAAGDMGAGQFGNVNRVEKAQFDNSYEGKILRFNLEPDGDAGNYDKWIPNDNPYNATLGVQSAVWAKGIRNNQGFAYDSVHDILYGSQHGPFSDDEINIIEGGMNYGHPLVIGYSWDDNVNNTTAGAAPFMSPPHPSSLPMIVDESDNATALGADYRDPIFSAYPNSLAFPSITNLWNTTTGANAQWPSEAWSGLDLYTNTYIPGWKQSLVAASLKWGRLVKLKLNTAGTTVIPTGATDTVSYFGSQNRFRDLAFDPNGKDMYVIMDNSSTTSGPGSANPLVPGCKGCVQKYTFLGYMDASGKSSIPTSVDVTSGTVNTCNSGTSVTIDATNNNLWVPITGPDGNIMAEIYPAGQNLGTITSSFYQHSGAIRKDANNRRYLNRNITITPAVQPGSPVKIRLYLTAAEYNALMADPKSNINSLGDLKIRKNDDACGGSLTNVSTTNITPQYAEAHGASGYVLQGDISSFSSFYIGSDLLTLPVKLLYFKGTLQDASTLLQWETANETNSSHFEVERGLDGVSFNTIGKVDATGNSSSNVKYEYTDGDAYFQPSPVLYYRLKMVDNDGGVSYSDIVKIVLTDGPSRLVVSPNPVSSRLRVDVNVPTTGRLQWSLVDNTGRVITSSLVNVRKGDNSFTIDMTKVPAGYYFLNVSGSGINTATKVQKL